MKCWIWFQALSKKIRMLAYIVSSISLYALVGFILLPWIIHPIIEENASEVLQRKVTMQSLELNPFTLSVTINDFSIEGKYVDNLFRFEKLYVNYQAIALFKGVFAFDEITLVRPEAKIILLATGKYNFQDIVSNLEKQAEQSGEAQEKTNDNGWPYAIDKFRYVEGNISFSDRNRKTPFNTLIEKFSISLDEFSTRAGDNNVHRIKAQTARGTKIDWQGEFSLSPLKSKGQIELSSNLTLLSDYLYDYMKLKINDGRLSLYSQYRFEYSVKGVELLLSHLMSEVSNIDISRKDNNQKVLACESVKLNLETFDLKDKRIVVNHLSAQGIYAALSIDKDNRFDFADLFVLQNVFGANDGEDEKEDSLTVEKNLPWDIDIKKISNKNSLLNIVDASVKPQANHKVIISQLEINNLKPFEDELALLDINMDVNDGGAVKVNAKFKPASRIFNIKLHSNSIELKYYQSYINDVAHINILHGFMSSDIDAVINASSTPPTIVLQGGVGLQQLKLTDKELNEAFLSWDALDVKDVVYEYPRQKLKIKAVYFKSPYLRLLMNGKGETNIQKLLVENSSEKEPLENINKNKKETAAFYAELKNIEIENGKMDFSDESLSQKFKEGIYQLGGSIKGLSTKELSKAKVDLKGKVDKYAPVTIKGDINPLSQDKFTEIEMLFKGVELTTFTPYSGKFAGYKIEKGKLSLDLNYKLSKNELVAENRVILDQLTLGEEVDSDDATSLPVKFALSLLKDANGVVDINLPIRGKIDEPDFQYGSLVWGALGNMIIGIVNSPFKALASLVGGDSEGLDYIVFSANESRLLETEKKKLDALASALLQRPSLYLEIGGVSSALIDHDEMAYAKILKKLKIKPATLAQKLNEDDQKIIIDYYEALTGKLAENLLPVKHQLSPVQQQKIIFDKSLIAVLIGTQVTDDEYRDLAQRRALLIQAYLIEIGKVPAENIFLLDSHIQLSHDLEDVEHAQLKLPLKLKAK